MAEVGDRPLLALVESAQQVQRPYTVPRETLLAFLGARVTEFTLAPERLEDLVLACACDLGEPQALREFENRYFRGVERSAARNSNTTIEPSDALQSLREKLFVKSAAGVSGISQYSGKSSLSAWFHVVAARQLITLAQRKPRETPTDGTIFLELVSPTSNPEMARIKTQHRAEVQAALKVAFEQLTLHDRNLLRHRFIDELSLIEISELYGVSRATINRWLLRLRSTLFLAVRTELQARLKSSESDLANVLETVQTSFELRLSQF